MTAVLLATPRRVGRDWICEYRLRVGDRWIAAKGDTPADAATRACSAVADHLIAEAEKAAARATPTTKATP